MKWKCAILSHQEDLEDHYPDLQNLFETLWAASGYPQNMALFSRDSDDHKSIVFYVSEASSAPFLRRCFENIAG